MKRVASLGLVVLCLCHGQDATAAAAQKGAGMPALSKEQWRDDLRYFSREMPKRHMNLFHSVSKEEFESAVGDLETAIPSLEDHQIVVRLHQIAARVGDGHTGVHQPSWFQLYPLSLFWFGADLRVTAATKEYERALGARVVRIGEVPIAEVESRVRTCFPSAAAENEWYELSTSPAFITRPEVLHALHVIADRASAPFTFEADAGDTFTLDLKPVVMPPVVQGSVVIPGMQPVAAPPLFRQKPTERFWFTSLPDSTVYVGWRGYDKLGEKARELFQFLDSHPVKRVVIDLRQNGGGDFLEGRKHVIRPVQKRVAVNQKGRLFVIIGRRTYSAALANAVDFRKDTNAILVGEPIGERPNSYSENDEMTLPNSRLVVSYSTRYYKFVDVDVPAVLPDVRIDPNWAEWRAGRDPVMDWILKQ
jgi:peptidase S41-like protein